MSESLEDWVPPGHKVRQAYRGDEAAGVAGAVDSGHSGGAEVSKWRGFGEAVLGFHRPVPMTVMCRCGQPLRVCDVRAQAEQYGLIPAACPQQQVAGCECSLCSPVDGHRDPATT